MAGDGPNPELDDKSVDEDLGALQTYLDNHPGDGGISFDPVVGPFVDESGTLFIGKEFAPAQFAEWYALQGLGTLPFNAVGIHHTAIPTEQTWRGPSTLQGIFNFYATKPEDGGPADGPWPRGVGPHLFLYDGTGSYLPGQKLVYVATHPAHDGIGIANFNGRWLHIEAVGNYDNQRMSPEMEELYRFVLGVVCGDRIPIENCKGRQVNNPATPLGLLFHRDSPTAKSCPGHTTTADWFFSSMQRIAFARTHYTASALLQGQAQATPEQAHGYLLGRGVEPQLATTVVNGYVDACAHAGLDFVLALAQTVLETTNVTTRIPFGSWWASPPRHNMAGIGVTGETRPHAADGSSEWQVSDNNMDARGYAFADRRAGIMAHVVHLAAYAYPKDSEPAGFKASMIPSVDPRLPAMESAQRRGSARTLNDLSGKWAADPNYGVKIATIAAGIAAAAPVALPESAEWVAPTGHIVRQPFLGHWRARPDALAIFGLPVTGEYLDAGTGLIYQWFERARFERRPDGGGISLGRVGAELAQAKGVPGATA